MTVYVDDMLMQADVPNGKLTVRGKWCHLMADTDDELIEFAVRIGLRRSWVQYPGTWKAHFDVVKSKRAAAVQAGAVEVRYGELTRKSNAEPWARRERPAAGLR